MTWLEVVKWIEAESKRESDEDALAVDPIARQNALVWCARMFPLTPAPDKCLAGVNGDLTFEWRSSEYDTVAELRFADEGGIRFGFWQGSCSCHARWVTSDDLIEAANRISAFCQHGTI